MPVAAPKRPRVLAADRVVAALGTALLIVAAAAAALLAGISGMASTGCTAGCRYDLVGAGTGVIAAGPALVLAAAGALLLLLRKSQRLRSWVPLVGLVVAVAVVALGEAVVASGVR